MIRRRWSPEASEPPILNQAAKSFIVSAGILVWLPPLLIAQIAPSTLAPGDTVRYRLEAGTDGSLDPVEGHLTEVSDSTLLVASGTAEPDTVAYSALSSLELAIGTRNYVFPLWAVGGVVGCAAGVVVAGPGDENADPTNHRLGGCLIGLGVGIAAGVFIGGRLHSPNWVEVAIGAQGQVSVVIPVGP